MTGGFCIGQHGKKIRHGIGICIFSLGGKHGYWCVHRICIRRFSSDWDRTGGVSITMVFLEMGEIQGVA